MRGRNAKKRFKLQRKKIAILKSIWKLGFLPDADKKLCVEFYKDNKYEKLNHFKLIILGTKIKGVITILKFFSWFPKM